MTRPMPGDSGPRARRSPRGIPLLRPGPEPDGRREGGGASRTLGAFRASARTGFATAAVARELAIPSGPCMSSLRQPNPAPAHGRNSDRALPGPRRALGAFPDRKRARGPHPAASRPFRGIRRPCACLRAAELPMERCLGSWSARPANGPVLRGGRESAREEALSDRRRTVTMLLVRTELPGDGPPLASPFRRNRAGPGSGRLSAWRAGQRRAP